MFGNLINSLCDYRCTEKKGKKDPECEKLAKYFRTLCPTEWVTIQSKTFIYLFRTTKSSVDYFVKKKTNTTCEKNTFNKSS